MTQENRSYTSISITCTMLLLRQVVHRWSRMFDTLRFPNRVFGSIVLVSGCTIATACRPPVDNTSQPVREISWHGRGGGFREWGAGGDYVYAVSSKPPILDVWKWHGDKLLEHTLLTFEDDWHPALLTGDRYVCRRNAENAILLVAAHTTEPSTVYAKWASPQGWFCRIIQPNRSGSIAALGFMEDCTKEPPPGHDWEKPRMRVGLISPQSKDIVWAGTLVGTHMGSDSTRRIVPSDDGELVGVAGWDNGVAVLDTQSKQTLWCIRPKDEVASNSVAFSPDSKMIYCGGGEGCVYGMDARTGSIRSRWFATDTGGAEYGHRISEVAVSPDGRFVAAGTGPQGLVWVWSVADGKAVRRLNHGGSTVLVVAFSPDSSTLATFVPGSIKLWTVADWDGTR